MARLPNIGETGWGTILNDYLNEVATGWIPANETWTYASATTFTVAGVDVTAKYSKGTRIKLTQTTAKYFVVVASSFATDTTVTVTGGSDYSLANAAITDPFYSYAANPQGYPGWFNYTPTFTGFSANPTVNRAVFRIDGNKCHVHLNLSGGTSNATTFTISLPVATLDVSGVASTFYGPSQDNGSLLATPSRVALRRNESVADVFKDGTGATWTASGTKGIFQVDTLYQI